jgi:putative Mg2+ transporter-C (MgtC) family protein
VLGQVVTGVGFLGAGVILTRDGAVAGMTSAAAVWFLAGVGAAIGYGYYAFGVGLTVFSLVVLLGVRGLERAFAILRRGVHAEHEDRA